MEGDDVDPIEFKSIPIATKFNNLKNNNDGGDADSLRSKGKKIILPPVYRP